MKKVFSLKMPAKFTDMPPPNTEYDAGKFSWKKFGLTVWFIAGTLLVTGGFALLSDLYYDSKAYINWAIRAAKDNEPMTRLIMESITATGLSPRCQGIISGVSFVGGAGSVIGSAYLL